MAFYFGSIVFISGAIASFVYLNPNWGFVCTGVILSGIIGKNIAS
jgi:hypothetical protein